ncbi:MAG: hypothetical protein IBJ18_09695 [Phycisphaerales bacterium]|nr:hypothetical protein [Phycisphaerales bacterium]
MSFTNIPLSVVQRSRRRVLLIAGFLASIIAAAQVHAQITVAGVQPIRWGYAADRIGCLSTGYEGFEDTQLAPGLQMRWTAPAGTVGPTSVLPRVTNPLTDDPTSNAFVGGVWSGTYCAVSGLGNQIHPYSASQNWGDVEFLFSPPVKVVGFSIQQMDLDAGLVVNGQNLGGVLSLSGLSANGGGRAGYVIISASGSDTISSIKLDNVAGDGFAIDDLNFSTTPVPTVTVSGVDASVWPRSDSALPITPARIEDFEDVNLVPGLQVGWDTTAGFVAPSSTLPNTFAPVTQDPFGDAFDSGTWDGSRCLINARNNVSAAYSGTGEWGDLLLKFNPPIQAVGFSMQQAESPVRLIVNGADVGGILQRAGLMTNGARHGYVTVAAPCTGGEWISEIRLLNFRIPQGGDGIALDHLIMGNSLLFAQQPVNSTICTGSQTTFTAAVQPNSGAVTYRWQIADPSSPGSWLDLTDGPLLINAINAATIQGAGGSTLTITDNPQTYFSGSLLNLRLKATSACGDSFSRPAQFVVIGQRCSPSDIADDTGTPLPPFQPCDLGHPNSGINEGDYNAFFSAEGFFNQAAQGPNAIGAFCDVADDQGTPLPPFGTGGTGGASNNGVNEGDYNAFFNGFFVPCV